MRLRAACVLVAVLAGPAASAAAEPLEKSTASTGKYEVPLEVARPIGTGPFPPVLYIHAKRGFQDEDRAHMRINRARADHQGFRDLRVGLSEGEQTEYLAFPRGETVVLG